MSEDRLSQDGRLSNIEGKVDTILDLIGPRVEAVEDRTASLEVGARNQNIFVVLYGAIVATVAWLRPGGGN